jgi:serine O-acetyltransferase
MGLVMLDAACICEGAGLVETIHEDLSRYAFTDDTDSHSPAALVRLVFSPKVWAVLMYRIIHYSLTRMRPRLLGRAVALVALVVQRWVRNVGGIQISSAAHIGPGLMVTHEGGIVIGPVRIGRHCTLSHGVTLGRGKAHGTARAGEDRPVLGDRVWVGPGAVIAGNVRVGADASVGPRSVVLRDVPPRGVVLGVPVRLVSRRGSFGQVRYRGMDSDPARLAAIRDARAAPPGPSRQGAPED